MANVIYAIILRETATRYGRHPGGYAWAIAEPVFFIVSLLFVSSALGRTHQDATTASHFASGVLVFMLFRETVMRALSAVSGNRGLLMHPVVLPVDIVLARSILELAGSIIVTALIAAGIAAVWDAEMPASPLSILTISCIASLFGTALGLLMGAAATVWPIVERLVGPIMRIGFFISGVFFVPATLPSDIREVLLWNPILHITEASRIAWLHMPPEQFGTLTYPLACSAVILLAGMIAERATRSRIGGS